MVIRMEKFKTGSRNRRVLFVEEIGGKRILTQLATGAGKFVPRFGRIVTALDGGGMRAGMAFHEWTPVKGWQGSRGTRLRCGKGG
jgi:hypothetical protein